jgi:hypothetical protein
MVYLIERRIERTTSKETSCRSPNVRLRQTLGLTGSLGESAGALHQTGEPTQMNHPNRTMNHRNCATTSSTACFSP